MFRQKEHVSGPIGDPGPPRPGQGACRDWIRYAAVNAHALSGDLRLGPPRGGRRDWNAVVVERGRRLRGDSVGERSAPRAVRSHRDDERAKHGSESPERAKRARRVFVDSGAGPREQLPWREATAKPSPSAMAAADAHTRQPLRPHSSEGHPPSRVSSSNTS